MTTTPRRRGAGGRVLRSVVALVVLVALLLPVAVAARVVQVASRDERVAADAVVVLGAAQLDGTPGRVLEARLEHTLELYEQGLAPLVVTTGGNQAGDRFTEADSARTWLIENGVPADAVRGAEGAAAPWGSAGELAREVVATEPDIHASADYRSAMLGNALRRLWAESQEPGPTTAGKSA